MHCLVLPFKRLSLCISPFLHAPFACNCTERTQGSSWRVNSVVVSSKVCRLATLSAGVVLMLCSTALCSKTSKRPQVAASDCCRNHGAAEAPRMYSAEISDCFVSEACCRHV